MMRSLQIRSLQRSAAALAVVTAFATAFGLALASDAEARGPGGFGKGKRLERAIQKLDLDEAKRAEVLGVIESARESGRALREQLRTEHRELRAMLEDPNVAEDAAIAQSDAVAAARAELEKHQLRTLLQVRSLLTPEQQAQLAEVMGKRHCGSRHERRHVL